MSEYLLTLNEELPFKETISGILSYQIFKRNIENCSFKYRIGHNHLKFSNVKIWNDVEEPIIYLHDHFIKENQNSDLVDGKLIDLCKLELYPEYMDLFNKFCFNIYHKEKLYGRNKPSHIKKNGQIINASLNGYWHYHCGPYDTNKNNFINDLSEYNWDGSTSGPAIHYLKYKDNNKDVFIIVAFATQHSAINKNDKNFQQKNTIVELFKYYL